MREIAWSMTYLHGRPSNDLQQSVLFRNSRDVEFVCEPPTVIQGEVFEALESRMFDGFMLVCLAQRRNLGFISSWVLDEKQGCL